jgi:hypothetical protein
MPSLQKADDRFMHHMTIIEGGSGKFKAIIDEPVQGSIPAYQFTTARRVLRVNPGTPVKSGQVIQTKNNTIFMLGDLGQSESIFDSYRLIEITGRYTWQRRGKTFDLVTQLEQDTGLLPVGMLWGSYEPGTLEAFDRQVRASFETARFITNQPVKLDDIVAGKRVTRVDDQLGLKVLQIG